MKGIVISSNSSGGGKTTVTLGLMKALKNRSYKIQSYKVGPDYIDSAFHSKITGVPSRNLDIYLMGEEGVKASFSRGEGDLAVVEGVMGFYDGKGIDTSYSTYDVAQILKLPTVLVLSPKAQVATLCAEINGIVNFKNANIVGVILNNISESYYRLLKASIEENCSVEVFGYLPKNENLSLKSRHLGLIQSSEVHDLEEKIQLCAELLEEHVDIDKILEYFKEVDKFQDDFHIESRGLKIGVALDKAFSFYYKENLELLEEVGEITYFSPMNDKELPKDLDFLYFGGGYPEVFKEDICNNKTMLKSIKNALLSGVRCYAECGGMMYLTEDIEDMVEGEKNQKNSIINIQTERQHEEKALVGFFSGKAYMTKKLQNFGYAKVEVIEKNNLLPMGTEIHCHEFHKSYVTLEEKHVYKLSKTIYDGTTKAWNCGYIKGNTLGAYAHIHFFSNMDFLKYILGIKDDLKG